MSKSSLTFKFCALRFLLQWHHREAKLHRAVGKPSPTGDAIRDALSFFQVSRSFEGIDDEKHTKRIARALVKLRTDTGLDPVQKVLGLAEAMKEAGFQRNVSASSKLLWLSARSPFKIYDERARLALTKLRAEPGGRGNYAKYFESWRAEYAKVEGEIMSAVQELPRARRFLPLPQPTQEKLLATVQKVWFRERVFDIYLWELGGEG